MVIALVVLITVLVTYVHTLWLERNKPSKGKKTIVGFIVLVLYFSLVAIGNFFSG